MKTRLIFCGFIASLFVGCTSETKSDFNPVEGNYGYMTHVSGFTDRSLTLSFCYRDTNGNTIAVWPSLKIVPGNNLVVSNDTALFVGGKAAIYPDGNERLTERLIAFKGPTGSPMDITDQVFQKYYEDKGLSLTNFLGFNSLDKTNGEIQILFGSTKGRPGSKEFLTTAFGSTLTISWNEIGLIMNDVKKNGKLKREKWSGFEYLQKD
jgi:hypothetical protein